jgi:hypothetical protein
MNSERDLKRLFERLKGIVLTRGLDPELLDYTDFQRFVKHHSYVLETRNRIIG